jgi:HPt (histidine-containing phosphotransfer) domain-containing protein
MFEQTPQTERNIFTNPPADAAKLKQMYPDDVLEELLPTFLKESHELLSKLENGWQRRDLRIICTQAHQLKGIAAVFTAVEMESLCGDLQRAAQDADWGAVSNLHTRVVESSLEVRAFVKTLLKK